MKRYLTFGIIFGVLVAIIVTASWFAFPAWRETQGGFLTLLGATILGVWAFLQSAVSVWKDLKEEKKEEPKTPAPSPLQSIDSQKADSIYNAPGGTINVYPKSSTKSESTLETPETWNLKHPYAMPPNFTGRVEERKMLADWLNKDNENRLFILRALGGFGKSALSWHWLTHDVDSNEWKKVLWWSFYEGDASFEHFIEETLKYLKLEIPQGQRPQVDELLKAMQSQKILLIMDGFERALRAYSSMNAAYQGDEAESPSPAGRGARGEGDSKLDCANINAEFFLRGICSLPNIKSKVLMTTRLTPRAVKPRGEFMLGCREVELTSMQPSDAVEFFHKQKIKGTRGEIEAACAPYGYHPLSLRLLAGRILKDLHKPGDISVAQSIKIDGDLRQHQNHVLKVAYESLPAQEKKLLGQIACFRSPVEIDTLTEISKPTKTRGVFSFFKKDIQLYSGKLDNDLHDLVNRGLLHHTTRLISNHPVSTFDLHPIVRRYAYDRLTAADRTGAHERLVNYFEAVPKPEKINSLEDLAPVIELYHHMVKVRKLDNAASLFRYRLSDHLLYKFFSVELIIELLILLFLDQENNLLLVKDKGLQEFILNDLAIAYSYKGQQRRALTLYELAIDISEKFFEGGSSYVYRQNMMVSMFQIGALRIVEYHIQQIIFQGEKSQREYITYFGHKQLGILYSYMGAWERSLMEFDMCLKIKKVELIEERTISALLMFRDPSFRKMVVQRPNNKYSREIKRKLKLYENPSDTNSIIISMQLNWLLGIIYRLKKNYNLSERHLIKAFELSFSFKPLDTEEATKILLDLARLRYDQKNYEEAKSLADEALLITERCGYVLQGADVNLFLAQYALEQEKDKAKAKQFAEEALKLATCDGPPYYYKVAYEEAERFLAGLNERS